MNNKYSVACITLVRDRYKINTDGICVVYSIYGRFDSKIRFEIESDGRFDSRFDSNAKKRFAGPYLIRGGHQIAIAGVLLTHQSSGQCKWQCKWCHVMLATVNLNGQLKLDAYRDLQPVQVSKQRCDMVVLPCSINQDARSIQHGLQCPGMPAKVAPP